MSVDWHHCAWLDGIEHALGLVFRAIAIDPCFIPKSGKKTPGLAYFWSGTANAAKRGLEILGMALVDACERTAVFLTATQTVTDRKPKGKKVPNYLAHLDNTDSLIGLYLKAFPRESDRFWKLTHLVIADAFFANISFVTGLDRLAFDLVSRLRDDARLRYLYNGPKENRKGRPRKFDGTADITSPMEDRFVVKADDYILIHTNYLSLTITQNVLKISPISPQKE